MSRAYTFYRNDLRYFKDIQNLGRYNFLNWKDTNVKLFLEEVYYRDYRAPLHEKCPKHHEHKGDPKVIPGTCGAIGKRAQIILVWMRAPDVGNTSHPRRLEGTRIRP